MSFDNFDFSKLTLVNFDSMIKCEGEVLPGFEFSKHFKLIKAPETHRCVDINCSGSMTKEKRSSLKLKYRYICDKCNQVINMAQYTWFSGTRLDVLMSLRLIFFWTTKCTPIYTAKILGLNKNTVTNYFNELRQLCINKCSDNKIKIGGDGHEVEVDETKVFHRKSHRGRLLFSERKKSWVIGGIDRATNACFAELVSDRGADTTKELIMRRVNPHTRLITDKWRSYLCLTKHNYIVDQVNHSKNFVDPIDPSINTQKIERAWRSLKTCLPKSANGKGRRSYIEEFVYRKTYFSKNFGLNFSIVLQDIAEFYPGCFLY